jgi:uncharacterized Zn-binding protein involved in type VI secretion
VAGALIGAAIAAAIVAAGVATGGLALVAIIGGCIAGGGLAGGALARGISTAANLPGPTTGVLALAGPTRVTVNGRAALRAGVDFASSCNGLPFNHIYKPGPVLIAQGSRTVTINGRPMARLEMQLECGAKIKTGSDNVTVGGPTATVVEIHDNEQMVETALQVVGFVALGAAGLGALAAGALAFGGFAAITAGSFFGMNALHDWGESLGPGYGDIMVGVAGFALLGLGARAAKTPAGRVGAQESALSRGTALFTEADPAREVLGTALNSHPVEVAQMRQTLADMGVEVIERPGSMAYSPGLRTGEPGQMIIDPDASYSAWLHEYQHAVDDQASGWGGMKALFDNDLRWQWEQNAYNQEINLARQLGHDDVAQQLMLNMERERQSIFGVEHN